MREADARKVIRARKAPALVALLAALAPAAAADAASPSKRAAGKLSPRLAEISSPALREATPARQADAVDLPRRGAASLVRSGERVTVQVRLGADPESRSDELRSAGARVVHVSPRYRTATVSVDPSRLRSLAAVGGVRSVTEVLAPMVAGAAPFDATGGSGPRSAAGSCTGSTVSEGDAQLGAAAVRGPMNVDGRGVKVGVLSDSYDRAGVGTGAAGDVASGDLPGGANPCGRRGGVQVLGDSVDGSDEGRAMLQIVHDLAPGAALAYATAFSGDLAFADNIRALRAAGSRVIVDDVTYFNEPFFQDGPISVAVNDVTAQGAAYFSSAANNNLLGDGGEDIASWESPAFRNAGSCPGVLQTGLTNPQCEDFDPGAASDQTFGVTVAPGAELLVDLQWAQPWNGVTTDLDAYVLNGAGQMLAASEYTNAGAEGTQQPFELVAWENTSASPQTVSLAINRDTNLGDALTPRLKFALLQNGSGVTATEYPASAGGDTVGPTIFGHNGAANASSVAAVPYFDSSEPQPYSSRGPVTHHFGPVSDTAAAAPLGAPAVHAKPDITATDCGLTTFFVPTGVLDVARFCGTSAAAPHAAAVAALQLQANPSLTPSQLRAAQAAGAKPVGTYGATAVGAGLLDAGPAVMSIARPPVVTLTAGPGAVTRDSTPTLRFVANRPASLTCAVDGAAPTPCSSPRTVGRLADGRHTLVVRALDAAGRTGSRSVSFRVDTTAPDTFVTAGPNGLTRERMPLFSFSSPAAGARFQCRFDDALFAACAAPGARPRTRLADGRHTFEVRAIDPSGNVDGTAAARSFEVDGTGPAVALKRHPRKRTGKRRARFAWTASEPVSAFECMVDGRPWKRCGASRRLRVRRGKHVFRVRATDRAGNVGPSAKFRWRVRR